MGFPLSWTSSTSERELGSSTFVHLPLSSWPLGRVVTALPEITRNLGDLTVFSHEREANLGEKERKVREELQIPIMPNLLDVFQFAQKTSFPRLWRFVMKTMTIMPTSVACEQSFSYFKRTRHINMGDETAKFFLMARLSHYDYDYNL